MGAQADLSPPDDGLWLSISEVARIKKVSAQAISKHVARLEAEGAIATREGPRGTKEINLAQYNLARNEFGDAAKELAAETVAMSDDATPAADPTYRDAQAREKKYRADLAELEVRQRLGELVPVADLAQAVAQCAEAIVAAVERLPQQANDVAAAVARDGHAGARSILKKSARALRSAIAEALQNLVVTVKGTDAAATAIDAEQPVTLWGDLDPGRDR